jgi:uncharacterized protein
MTLVYLDSSAAVKLILREDDSNPLQRFIQGENPWHQALRLVGSDLVRVETMRACARSHPQGAAKASELMRAISLVRISPAHIAVSATHPPPELRTLDALHLVTALTLTPELVGMITYDERLRESANAAGIKTFSPT